MKRLKKVLAVLMTFLMTTMYMPMTAFAASGSPFSVNGTEYETLAEAVQAAEEGDTVQVQLPGTYNLVGLPDNITIKGSVDGVVFDCDGSGNIAAVPNGAVFENVTMNFGNNNYHGFQHAGVIDVNNCVLNGKFFSYGDMNFNGCTFNAPGTEPSGTTSKDYSMWAYSGNLTFTACIFNCAGKCLNVYNESGAESYTVSAADCTFNSTVANKAAFNVKETSGSNVLNFAVDIQNCSCNENFPAASSTDALVVLGGLVQVDDRAADGSSEGGNIKVAVDGTEVYSTEKTFTADDSGIYHISDAAALVKFMKLVNSGKNTSANAVLDANIDMQDVEFAGIGTAANKFSGSFDGNGKTVSNLTIEASSDNAGFFGKVWDADIKALTLKDIAVTNTATDYTAALVGSGYARIDNCVIDGGSVAGVEQVGGIIGYLSCGHVNDCAVQGVTVTAADGRVGGIAGKVNVDSDFEITDNTVSNVTVQGSLSAGLVGQVMTAQDRNHYLIKDNALNSVTVLDENGADAFNPIGNFRSGSFDANAVKGGKITGNSWNPMTTPNAFKMVNPADETQYIIVENANKADVAKIGDKKYTSLQEALNDAVAAKDGDVTVEIIEDIDLTYTDWTPVKLSGNKNLVTIEGNNHSITGLNEMLFGSAWASKGLVIKDITIKDSQIVHDESNSIGTEGVGAFVGYVEATETVTLDNCHVIDSTVNGGNWVGGFVGACGGYNNANDGPVFTTLTIKDSSVEGCTIKNLGAAGAFVGHGAMNAATKVILEGSATGNTISGGKPAKTGKLIGTIGACGPAAFNGEKGAIELNVEESGNTGAENVAGRIGTSGGTMIVIGGSYESNPLVTSDNSIGTIATKEGFAVIENNGIFTVLETTAKVGDTIYPSLAEAVEAATAGEVVTLLKDYTGDGIKINKDITIDLGGFTYTVDGNLEGSTGTKTQAVQILKENTVTIKNGTITTTEEAGAKMLIQNYANLTLTDVTLDGKQLAGSGRYVLSNNSGNVMLDGATEIIAKDGDFAFDACKFGSYDAPAITVNTTGTITGNIEASGGKLNIQSGKFNGTVSTAAGYKAGDVAISGGAFAEKPDKEYCAAKYLPSEEADADGYYTVVKSNEWDEELAEQLADQVAELQKNIDINKDAIDALDDIYATDKEVADKISEAKAAIEAAQAAIDAAQDAKTAADIAAAVAAAKTALEAADAKTLTAAKAYTDAETASLQTEIDANKAAISALEEAGATKAELADAKAAIENAQAAIDAAQDAKTAADLAAAVAEAKTALEAADAKTLAAAKVYTDAETAKIQAQIDNLDKTYATDADADAKIAKAIETIKAAQEKADALQNINIKNNSNLISEMQKKIEELSGKTDDALTQRVAALETENEKVNNTIVELEKQIQEIKKQALQDKIESVMVNLKAKASGTKSVKLTWNTSKIKVNGQAVSYKIYYKKKTAKKWTLIKTKQCSGDGKTMTYTKKGLVTGTKYMFKVVPSVVVDGETYLGSESEEVIAKPVPAKVKIKTVKGAKKSFKVTFKKVSGATGYQISYRNWSTTKAKKKFVKKNSVTIKKLTAKNKKYTVKVRAYKTVKGKKIYGAWSKAKYVTVR